MKKIALTALVLLFFGCSQKNETRYYLPESSMPIGSIEKVGTISVETASYLAGEKIWYKKDGIFLPYKNSYLAKTPKEFMTSEFEAMPIGKETKITVEVSDAYQLYEASKSSFVLVAKIEMQDNEKTKKYKVFKVVVDGLGEGAKEAVKGFEKSVLRLRMDIEKELKEENN